MRMILAAAAALLASVAMPAQAVTIHADVQNINYDAARGGGIGLGTYTDIGPAGRFVFHGTNTSTNASFDALTFCVDIFRAVGTGHFVISPLSSLAESVEKQQQLAGILSHAGAIIDAAVGSDARNDAGAALQLAIWEILYENGTSGYDVSNGHFYTFGSPDGSFPFQTLWGQANSYLAQNWLAPAERASILLSFDSQSQIYLNPGVPEPAAWLTMILGFGIVGAATRKRRQGSAMLKPAGGVSIAA
jgi:hypothetical protein